MKKHPLRNYSGRLQHIARKLKLRTWISLGILLILTPVILLSLFHSQKADAAWFNDSWAFRKRIPITAHTAAETNKYFSVTVDTSDTTKFQADCGDIRFTDNTGTLLQYYISSGCSSASTVLHVNVPTFPAGATDYYMYYGNANAVNGFSSADFTAGTSVTVGSVGSEEKGTGPIAYWNFGQGTDNTCSGGTNDACDQTANHFDAAFSGSPVWKSEDLCVSGKCLYYSGSNSANAGNQSLLNFERTNAFSVGLWMRTNSSSAMTLISKMASSAPYQGWNLQTGSSTGYLHFQLNNNYGSNLFVEVRTTSSTNFNDNKWHYVVATYSGSGAASGVHIYFDGQDLPLTTVSDTLSTNSIQNSSSVHIGSRSAGDQFYTGFLDEVKVYNYARSASQVKADLANNSYEGISASLGSISKKYLSDGLVGYWKMDETSTAATDYSGKGNTATWQNSPSATAGKFGNSISLNGTTQGLSLATDYSTLNTAFTISAWIYPTSLSSTRAIFGTSTGNRFFYNIETDGSLSLCNDTGDSSCTFLQSTAGAVVVNTWQHVVLTHDGSLHYRFYVNGVDRTSVGTAAASSSVGSTSQYIGADQTALFAGRIDEFRIYNKGFSAQDVRNLYNYAPGPLGYWKLDENTGTSAYDSSGNGNTGTLTAFVNQNWVNGKFGSAVQFDGVDSRVDAGSASMLDDLPTNGGITLGAWIYPRSSGENSSGRILDKNDTGPANGWQFLLNSSQKIEFQADFATTDLDVVSTNAVTLNTWQYVSVVWDGSVTASNVKIYLNGVLQTHGTDTDASGAYVTDAAKSFMIGNGQTGTRTFDGFIDEALVYNYNRSASQIIEDMNGGHPVGGSPIGSYTSYWKMDEANGTTAHDANSINQNDLTLSTATSAWNTLGKVNAMWVGAGTNWLSRADDADFDLAAADDASISMWFKSTSASNPAATQYLFTKGGPSSVAGYALYATTSGTVCFGIDDDTTWGPDDSACSTADIYDATWHHLVAEKTGTTEIRLYVDGKSVGSDTTIAATSTLANASTMYVGDDDGDSTNSFAGNIDEVKFYRSALTQDQVLLDMNSGSAVNYGTGQNEATQITGTAETAPIAYLQFDENTGTTVNDTSGNGKTGTLRNNAKYVTGKIGGGIYFDGISGGTVATDTHMSFVDSTFNTSFTNAFTIETWLKPNDTGDDFQDFFAISVNSGLDAGTYMEMGYERSTDKVWFYSNWAGAGQCNGSDIRASAVMPGTQTAWHHIAFTMNSSGNAMYIDGIKQSLTYTSGSSSTFCSNMQAWTTGGNVNNSIGCFYTSSTQCYGAEMYEGSVDEFKIYDYARTQAQISYDYNRGAPVGWWKFDECQGSTAYDASGFGNNGTISIGGAGSQTSVGTCGTSSTAWGNGAVGRFNSSLNFDGNDDTVTGSDTRLPNGTNPRSISVWVNTPTLPSSGNEGNIFIYGSSATNQANGIQLRNTSGTQYVRYAGWNNDYDVAYTIPTSTWVNIIGTHDSTSTSLYVNGKLIGSSASFSAWNTVLSSFTVGGISGGSLLAEKVDDIRVYNYVLTQTQINKLYNEGAGARFGPVQGTPLP